MDETSSYKEVRKLVRNGYKIGVQLCFDGPVVWLQKTDWLKMTKERETLQDYDGETQVFYIDVNEKYIVFTGVYV